MSANSFDVIVIGVGSMGSATCYQLARQGIRVLGLEQFSIPNEMGSHTGQSRIIRKAYFEHTDYVPLLERAYTLWSELERISNTQVYYPTGLLYIGKADHPVIAGVKLSASTFAIPLEKMTRRQAELQFPQMVFPENTEVLFEPEAGFIRPELAIQAFTDVAVQHGAVIKSSCTVLQWRKVKNHYEVNTTEETYRAKKIIITAGPWIERLLPELGSRLRITRQVLAWFGTTDTSYALGKFPSWIIADDAYPGVMYGFPELPADRFDGPVGLKLAHHYQGEATDPATLDRSVSESDVTGLVDFAKRYFTNLDPTSLTMKICMYTNTPDEHFILDFVPGHDKNVMVATGFSGHGFKFASVIGEIMSELAREGGSRLPIEFLKLKRLRVK